MTVDLTWLSAVGLDGTTAGPGRENPYSASEKAHWLSEKAHWLSEKAHWLSEKAHSAGEACDGRRPGGHRATVELPSARSARASS
jgi:hypothetical protein